MKENSTENNYEEQPDKLTRLSVFCPDAKETLGIIGSAYCRCWEFLLINIVLSL